MCFANNTLIFLHITFQGVPHDVRGTVVEIEMFANSKVGLFLEFIIFDGEHLEH